MIRMAVVIIASAASLAVVPAAEAAGGCGVGWHRGPMGGCRPNGEAVVVAPSRVVVAPRGALVIPPGRACPFGYHLGPYGHRCLPN
ncbi:MAG: hypothetical protein JO127_10125 [Caulobacteraceae bacterium]|nr:hypothetical protein [Caulobacteraceae bacterium]